MHVPWGWIKQRPHFLAEKLCEDFDVDVYYRKPLSVRESTLKEEKNSSLSISSFISIPFLKIPILKKIPRINHLNVILAKLIIHDIKKYDIIWITSPTLYPIIKPLVNSSQKIVYDCMDDTLSFPMYKNHLRYQNWIKKCEEDLIRNSYLSLYSAEYLKNTLFKRYEINDANLLIINNAIEVPHIEEQAFPDDVLSKLNYVKDLSNVFMYVGTIEEWLDISVVLKSLEANPQMNVVLIGPSNIQIPSHPRLHHLGIIKRDFIFPFMQKAKALIMPFKVTELIKSVNPVKLYEYIWMNKPIIAPKYDESVKFEEHVYLYNNVNEYLNFCEAIINNSKLAKSSEESSRNFVKDNTWDKRYEKIKERLLPNIQ